MKKFLILFFLCAALYGQNLASDQDSASEALNYSSHYIGIGFVGYIDNVYKKDFMLTLSFLGEIFPPAGLSFTSVYLIRPYYKKVAFKENKTTYYIFRELRMDLMIGLIETIPLNKYLDIFGGLLMDPAWHIYSGSNRDNIEVFFPVLDFGIHVKAGETPETAGRTSADIGYRFLKEDFKRNGFYFTVRFRL